MSEQEQEPKKPSGPPAEKVGGKRVAKSDRSKKDKGGADITPVVQAAILAGLNPKSEVSLTEKGEITHISKKETELQPKLVPSTYFPPKPEHQKHERDSKRPPPNFKTVQ
eukprot:TRINITY_DN2462_c0_g1_i1.p1 TRINITY_DN2462_c0_g1~~TRINITY_DN2462_c0_g1_i1.p1  ORF type:complete len:120 (-),score=42.81 TRINITY_DN2462_c0_g1_i1:82-411(-)